MVLIMSFDRAVPTWSALRRLTALFILSLDYLLDNKSAPLSIWASVRDLDYRGTSLIRNLPAWACVTPLPIWRPTIEIAQCVSLLQNDDTIVQTSLRKQSHTPFHMGFGERPSWVPKFPHPRRKHLGPDHSLAHLAHNPRNCSVRISAAKSNDTIVQTSSRQQICAPLRMGLGAAPHRHRGRQGDCIFPHT